MRRQRAMRNQFFTERYAHEKHQAYLREAVNDRLTCDPPAAERQARGRNKRVKASVLLAAGSAVAMLSFGSGTSVGLASVFDRFNTYGAASGVSRAATGGHQS